MENNNDKIDIEKLISEISEYYKLERSLTPEEKEFIEGWNATIGKYSDGHEKNKSEI